MTNDTLGIELVDYLRARFHLLASITPAPSNDVLPRDLRMRANELAQLAQHLGLIEELRRLGAPVPPGWR